MINIAQDIAQDILDLLFDNWTASNTDDITPEFIKITDQKAYDFKRGSNSDVVFCHVVNLMQDPAGIGTAAKRVHADTKLDIRVYGKDNEAHFYNVVAEVISIFDGKIVDPITGYQEAWLDNAAQINLSDASKGTWRMLLPLKLHNYNVSRT